MPSALTWLGCGFALAGLACLVAPATATLASQLLIAGAMVCWGVLGVGFSVAMRPFPEWIVSALFFAVLAALGIASLADPSFGIELLSLIAVAGFLTEGVLCCLFALRLSRHNSRWIWMAASGVASLAAGLVALLGWPGTAKWLLGALLGLNFLTTGIALLALRKGPLPVA